MPRCRWRCSLGTRINGSTYPLIWSPSWVCNEYGDPRSGWVFGDRLGLWWMNKARASYVDKKKIPFLCLYANEFWIKNICDRPIVQCFGIWIYQYAAMHLVRPSVLHKGSRRETNKWHTGTVHPESLEQVLHPANRSRFTRFDAWSEQPRRCPPAAEPRRNPGLLPGTPDVGRQSRHLVAYSRYNLALAKQTGMSSGPRDVTR